MKIAFSCAAIAVLAAAVGAQSTFQQWDMFSGSVAGSSRASLGAAAGEMLQGVHASSNRGVLDVGGMSQVRQFSLVTQDQNCATTETFSFVVRSGDDVTGPVAGAPGLLGGVSGLTLPSSTTNGPCAWSLTVTLPASAPIMVPTTQHWSYGIGVSAAPTLPADGQSVQLSINSTHNTHSRVEDHAWQIIAGAVSHPSANRAWRMSVYAEDGAVLKLRCGGVQSYGGSFPRASTAGAPLALDARIDGGSNCAGAVAVAALALTRTSGFPVFAGANLYLGPFNSAVYFGGPADSAGVAVVPILPFVPAIAAGVGTIHCQGALDASGVVKLTNSQSITP